VRGRIIDGPTEKRKGYLINRAGPDKTQAPRRSMPPMYGRSTSGITTLPSACW